LCKRVGALCRCDLEGVVDMAVAARRDRTSELVQRLRILADISPGLICANREDDVSHRGIGCKRPIELCDIRSSFTLPELTRINVSESVSVGAHCLLLKIADKGVADLG
jgi:hypothetical protein